MKFALVLSSYAFPEFVELNLNRLRAIFGTEAPVLVSDDRSPNSEQIEAVASKYGASYVCSRVRLSHFAGDLQSIVNGISFAQAHNADILIKVSLRLILLDPELKVCFENYFKGSDLVLALPQKLHPTQVTTKSGMGFAMFPVLTDVMLLRVGRIDPQNLIDRYRKKCATEKFKHSWFIESLFYDLHLENKDSGRSMTLGELSWHQKEFPHRYLRKAQNHRMEYIETAKRLGIEGRFLTDEWSFLEGVNYRPRPLII